MIIGVWTYTNPRSWKNLWIAKETTERTLKTALKVLVLGRKWAIVLKYSKVCLFFWSGYSEEARLNISILVAWISKGCLAFSVLTNFPSTIIEEAIVNFLISSKLERESLKTIWTFLKKEPSLISIKPKVLESLTVFTQPLILISFSK